jgi:hypothetical protein
MNLLPGRHSCGPGARLHSGNERTCLLVRLPVLESIVPISLELDPVVQSAHAEDNLFSTLEYTRRRLDSVQCGDRQQGCAAAPPPWSWASGTEFPLSVSSLDAV